MATVKYRPAMPSDIMIPGQEGTLLYHDETSATFLNGVGDTRVFSGHDFVYDDDALVGGTVTRIAYMTSSGPEYYRVTNFEWDMALGEPVLFGGNDVFIGSRGRDYLHAEGGDDRIRGGRGEDYVRGGEGNDILRGGAGGDHFVFYTGDGRDRILDFDTTGRHQDVIQIRDVESISELNITQHGHRVVIDFGGDDRIILLHVGLDDLALRNFDFG